MAKHEEWRAGHEPIERRINVRAVLSRLRIDPLIPFVSQLSDPRRPRIIHDTISRYQEAYQFYYLSLERFLPEMSLAIRWSNGPYYVRKYGGRYTHGQARLAKRFNAISRYLPLDFFNCLLHARMLVDRVVSLSRYFLKGPNLPSFTSFNEHKKFFQHLRRSYGTMKSTRSISGPGQPGSIL